MLFPTHRLIRLEMLANEEGIGPESWFPVAWLGGGVEWKESGKERSKRNTCREYNSVRLERLPNEDGISPVKLFFKMELRREEVSEKSKSEPII